MTIVVENKLTTAYIILWWACPTSIYRFFGVGWCVGVCVRDRKVSEADLTMMMKIKVVSCDEYIPKTQ